MDEVVLTIDPEVDPFFASKSSGLATYDTAFNKWPTSQNSHNALYSADNSWFNPNNPTYAFYYGAASYGGNAYIRRDGLAYVQGSWSERVGDHNFARGKQYTLTVDFIKAYNALVNGNTTYMIEKSRILVSATLQGPAPTYEIKFKKEWDMANYPVNTAAIYLTNLNQDNSQDLSFDFMIPDDAEDWADWTVGLLVRIEIIGNDSRTGHIPVGGNTTLRPWCSVGLVTVVDQGDADEKWREEERRWQEEQRGFWERLWQFLQGMWDAIVNIPTAIGEFFSNLINAIGDWFAQLGQWFADLWNGIVQLFEDIKDFFIHLFIPEEGELQDIVDDFKLFAEGKLGFVAQIFTLVGTVIGELVNGGGGDVVLTLPGVQLPGAFGGVQLWQDTPFNLTAMVNSNAAFTTIYTIYKVLASVLLLGLLLRYLYRVASDILGQRDGGGEET